MCLYGTSDRAYEMAPAEMHSLQKRLNCTKSIIVMSKRIYVDTNIYLDLFEERKDNIKPLGEFAFQLFQKALACEFTIVISEPVLSEINRTTVNKQIAEEFLQELKDAGKLICVRVQEEDRIKADCTQNYFDAMHAILARKAGCEYLVSRNLKDFEEFDFIETVLPEDLL